MKIKILKYSFLTAILGITLWSCNKIDSTPVSNDLTSAQKQELEAEFKKGWKDIGEMIHGLPTLTIDKVQALENYNNNLFQMSHIEGNFNDVSIVELADGSLALVFVGEVYSSSFYVRADQSGRLKAFSGTSCTTSDCSSELLGCVVKYESDLAYCSPCSNGGTCTKTSSSSSLF